MSKVRTFEQSEEETACDETSVGCYETCTRLSTSAHMPNAMSVDRPWRVHVMPQSNAIVGSKTRGPTIY